MEKTLPPIPPKRYFTIGEVSELCQVKPYVLRYWEQEFTQLKPMKRRGNRRYYQHHEVLLIRRIRALLYEQGFTINGARNRLADAQEMRALRASALAAEDSLEPGEVLPDVAEPPPAPAPSALAVNGKAPVQAPSALLTDPMLRIELESIRRLLDA